MLKHLFIAILIAGPLAVNASSQVDSLVNVAYNQHSYDSGKHYLEQATRIIQNDTQEATVHYYSFYIHDDWNQDSLRTVFFDRARVSLAKTGQWRRYFKVHSHYSWQLCNEGHYDSVIWLCMHAKNLAVAHNDRFYECRFLRIMSITFHDLTQYDKGIKMGYRALEVAQTLPPEERDKSVAGCLVALGINYDDKGELDSAITVYRMAHSLKDIDPFNAFDLANNMGNTFIKVGLLDSATVYLKKALRIAKELNEDYSLSTVYNNLGRIEMKTEHPLEAKALLDSALIYAKQSENLEKLRDTYFSLSEYYQLTGQFETSLSFLKRYHQVQDSMVNAQRIQAINEIQFKLETEKKDRLLTESGLKLKNRNLWIFGISTVVLVLLLLVRSLINRRRQLAQESSLRLQEERLRISRDLHDHIGSELTFISSFADREAFVESNPEDKVKMNTISDASRRAMQQLRDTIWAIKTQEITSNRFITKLSSTIGPYADKLGNDFQLYNDGPEVKLSPAQAIALFRVCQEAFSNFVRHSGGTSIEFKFTTTAGSDQLKVAIQDNGHGLNVKAHTSEGMGIENMKQRISDINGTFEMSSTSDQGCRIDIAIPLSIENKLEP